MSSVHSLSTSSRSRLLRLLAALAVLAGLALPARAQIYDGSFGVGVAGMAAKYFGEFKKPKVGFSIEGMLQYNILKYLSVRLTGAATELRFSPDADNLANYDDYYADRPLEAFFPTVTDSITTNGFTGLGTAPAGSQIRITDLNKVKMTNFGLHLNLNLTPEEVICPYLTLGVEYISWKTTNSEDVTLPNLAAENYRAQAFMIPAGVGIHFFPVQNFGLNLYGAFRYSFTDSLDDYSVNRIGGETSPTDAFFTVGLGIEYMTGSNDCDGDGFKDEDEIAAGTDPCLLDTDGDGLKDGDEVLVYKTNPKNPDTDGDGLKDGEEVLTYKTDPLKADTDGDGLKDGDEVKTHKTDPLKPDTDGDGLADGAEVNQYRTNPLKTDTDGDSLTDGDEVNRYKTDPTKTDSDGDGLADGAEVNQYKTDPSKADSDGDSLTDGAEVNQYKTNPLLADSDGDDLNDGEEVNVHKTNPLNKDTDGDNLTDGIEVKRIGTSPLKPDTDGDTVRDDVDRCPLIAGKPNADDPDRNGCPERPKKGTKVDFSDVYFIVNTDQFNFEIPETEQSLRKMLAYMQQCDGIGVTIEGHASKEGNPKRNQELSEMRARRVQGWLIENGVNPSKITATVGYGSSREKVKEPTGAALKKISAAELEAIRKQNRRIAILVTRGCD